MRIYFKLLLSIFSLLNGVVVSGHSLDYAKTFPACNGNFSGPCYYEGKTQKANGEASENYYEGIVENNQWNRYGRFSYRDEGAAKGSTYEGEWRAGKVSGKGTFFYQSGTRYDGLFLNGLRHGQGVTVLSDGTRFEGNYVNDSIVRGVVLSPSGQRYEGEFSDGKPNGYGIYIFPNGTRYEGRVVNGTYQGEGTLVYPNGQKFVGTFKNNMRDGVGILYDENSKVIQDGVWSGGNFVSASPKNRKEKNDNPAKGEQSQHIKCKRLGLIPGGEDYQLCIKSSN